MKVLTSREARIVEAIGLTMFPRGGAIELSASDVGVVDYVDDLMSKIPTQERALLRLMFVLFELGPVIVPLPRPGRFTRLSPDQRHRHLMGWESSRLWSRRTAYAALRSVMLMAYAGSPEVEREMGVGNARDALRQWRRSRSADPASAPAPSSSRETSP